MHCVCCNHLVCYPSDLKMITAALAQGVREVRAQFPFTTTASAAVHSSSTALGGQPSQHGYLWGSAQGPRKAQGPVSTFVRHIVIVSDFFCCGPGSA